MVKYQFQINCPRSSIMRLTHFCHSNSINVNINASRPRSNRFDPNLSFGTSEILIMTSLFAIRLDQLKYPSICSFADSIMNVLSESTILILCDHNHHSKHSHDLRSVQLIQYQFPMNHPCWPICYPINCLLTWWSATYSQLCGPS